MTFRWLWITPLRRWRREFVHGERRGTVDTERKFLQRERVGTLAICPRQRRQAFWWHAGDGGVAPRPYFCAASALARRPFVRESSFMETSRHMGHFSESSG